MSYHSGPVPRPSLAVIALFFVALFLFAGTVACAEFPSLTAAPIQTGEVSSTESGTIITPRKAEPAEWAEILNIQRWKFDVAAGPNTELHYRLEIRQPGEEPSVLAGFSIITSDSFDGDTLIALYPIGDDFYHAAELKSYIRSGGASTARTFENPFQGWSAFKPNQPPALAEASAYELMIFSKNGSFPDPANAQIVLSVSAKETSP